MSGVEFQAIPADCEPNHWLTTITVDPPQFGANAVDIIRALHAAGIEARHGFKPMHLQPVFADAPVVGGAVSAELFATSVSLPSGGRITDDDVAWICEVIASARL